MELRALAANFGYNSNRDSKPPRRLEPPGGVADWIGADVSHASRELPGAHKFPKFSPQVGA